jgi:predicted  nucleic acid-binding Zn-ribbon protein
MVIAMSKKMTLEDLAVMIQGEFKEIYRKLGAIEDRLTRIEERLDHIEFNQTSQERRISTLEDKVRIISTKLGLDTRKI